MSDELEQRRIDAAELDRRRHEAAMLSPALEDHHAAGHDGPVGEWRDAEGNTDWDAHASHADEPKCPCIGVPAQTFPWVCRACGAQHPARGPHLITHWKSGKSEYCGGPGCCPLCEDGKPASRWLQFDATFGSIPVEDADPELVASTEEFAAALSRIAPNQSPLTAERLATLQPNDAITLVAGGRITTHIVTAVDPSAATITLADLHDGGSAPVMTYGPAEPWHGQVIYDAMQEWKK